MKKLTRKDKMAITKRTLDSMCLKGDLLGKTLELSEYLDILVIKEQCSIMGIKGMSSMSDGDVYTYID